MAISTIALVWYSLGWAACGAMFADGWVVNANKAVRIILLWPIGVAWGLISAAIGEQNQYLWRRK